MIHPTNIGVGKTFKGVTVSELVKIHCNLQLISEQCKLPDRSELLIAGFPPLNAAKYNLCTDHISIVTLIVKKSQTGFKTINLLG